MYRDVGEPTIRDSIVSGFAWETTDMRWPDRSLFEGQRFRRAMADAVARDTANRVQLSSKSNRVARARSQSQFASLDADDSLQLARQRFTPLMTADHDSLRLKEGQRIVRFPSVNAAVIVDARGDRSLLLSSDPVAAGDGADREQVNLSLVERAGGNYGPARAAAEVVLPEQADEFLRLERSGLGVRPEDATPAVAELSDNRLFYSDIGTDTDYISTPTRAGAQVMWQLRSEYAPEQLGLDLDLPEGATLRLTSDLTAPASSAQLGDVEIIRDGEVLSTITAPVAFDAQGQTVEASFRLDGGRLVVDVAHRDKDLLYPILVDPEVREVWGAHDFLNTCGGGPTNFGPGKWSYGQTGGFQAVCNEVHGGGVGIFIVSQPWFYENGQTGYWMWGAPSGAYIAHAWFDNLRHQAAGTYLYTGLTGSGAWGSLAMHPSEFLYGQFGQYPDSAYRSWSAVVGLTTEHSFTRPHIGVGGVRGVNLLLGDLDAPLAGLQSLTNGLDAERKSRWTNDLTTYNTATVRGIDGGLGIHEVAVVRDGTGAVIGSARYPCAGHRSSRCPQDWSANFPLYLNPLPEGYNAIQARAVDIVGNGRSEISWIQRIDRSGPVINISGELYDRRGDGQYSANPGIAVHARDGDVHDGTSAYRSGVRRVRLSLDGIVREEFNTPHAHCENCDAGPNWSIPSWMLGGSHRVTVEAWDYTNNYSSSSFDLVGEGPEDGVLAREQSSSVAYFLLEGVRYQLASWAVANELGVDLNSPTIVSNGQLAVYEDGGTLTLDDLRGVQTGLARTAGNGYGDEPVDIDYFDAFSADWKARIRARVEWWRGQGGFLWLKQVVRRGEPVYSAITEQPPMVEAVEPVGCIWTRLTWEYRTGGISVPPSVDVQPAEVSSNHFVSCRRSGQTRPTRISLYGLGYAKGALKTLTITVCTSASRGEGPRFCGSDTHHYNRRNFED